MERDRDTNLPDLKEVRDAAEEMLAHRHGSAPPSCEAGRRARFPDRS